MNKLLSVCAACVATVMLLASNSLFAGVAGMATSKQMSDMKFERFPGMPECADASGVSGDPSTDPSLFLVRMKSNCIFPWHWHSSNEELMIVSGKATIEMKDGNNLNVTGGSYAMMPLQHIHRFNCHKDCVFFVRPDGVFDMHFVNEKGEEITPEQALAAQKKQK